MKKAITTILVMACMLAFAHAVQAADETIVCKSSGCTPSTITGFFPASEVWYPGNTLIKTIEVKNESGQDLDVSVDAQNDNTSGNFDQAIQFTIARDGAEVWDGSLYSFYRGGQVELYNAMPNGKTQLFTYTAHMYATSGNEYQEKGTQFDMALGFYGGSSSSACSAPEPAVPGQLNLQRVSDSEVKAVWGAATGDVTGYRISWSRDTDTDADGAGSKSVGKTTEINIGGLELAKYGYYFKIRAVNDCREGQTTGIVFIGAGSDLRSSTNVLGASSSQPSTVLAPFTAASPPGEGDIQGASTESAKSTANSTLARDIGQVKGESVTCSCIWWQILALEAMAGIAMLFGKGKLKWLSLNAISAIGLGLAGFAVFRAMNTCLEFEYGVFADVPSLWCRYFAAFSMAVPSLLFFIRERIFSKIIRPS